MFPPRLSPYTALSPPFSPAVVRRVGSLPRVGHRSCSSTAADEPASRIGFNPYSIHSPHYFIMVNAPSGNSSALIKNQKGDARNRRVVAF